MAEAKLDVIVAGQTTGYVRVSVPFPAGPRDCDIELNALYFARDLIRHAYFDHKKANNGTKPTFRIVQATDPPSDAVVKVAAHLTDYIDQLYQADTSGTLHDTRVYKKLGN